MKRPQHSARLSNGSYLLTGSRLIVACLLLVLGLAAPSALAADGRPKIGLALGGGGALGFAHIGVLRALEEYRVPIDCIAGTSMGSIIAGLYASGMSPDEIQAFLEGLDWGDVMSDQPWRRELYFRRKMDDQRYLFELGVGRGGFRWGTGMAAGQKFNNLMEYMTLRSSGIRDFDELPIPYRAVATDLLSGQAYVISTGRIARAMRASMAVPGIFTPVELDGRVLVDGGVVNNLPVDVVEAMGAEIVIAVDVGASSDHVDKESLKSLGGIIGRTYTVAQRPDQLKALARADVGIQPDLDGFTASQFPRVAAFVPRGEAAARVHSNDLARYSVDPETFSAYLARQRRPPPANLVITGLTVSGQGRVSEKAIRGRARMGPGSLFDADGLQQDLMRIYGIGEFEQVLFRLDQDENGNAVMHHEVTEKPWGPTYFKYGLQLSTDFDHDADWAMLLNVTRMSLNPLGAEWRNEAEIGSRQDFSTELYQPLDDVGLFFVAPSVEYTSDIEDLYDGEQRVAEYNVSKLVGRVDAGVQLRQHAELRVGPFWGSGEAEVDTGSADLPEFDEDFSGARVRLDVDRQDRTIFPRTGYLLQAEGTFVSTDMGGDVEFDKVEGRYRGLKSFGDHTFGLGIWGGTALGTDLPGYAQFTLGGPFNFAGLADDQFRGSYAGVLSLGYGYRLMRLPSQLGRAVYLQFRGDAGNVWDEDIETDDVRHGAQVALGIDSSVGPILLSYGAAEGGYEALYYSMGTAF
jgi:NTE family protein